MVPNIYASNSGYHGNKDASRLPVHFNNPLFDRKSKQAQGSSDLDYGLGYVPPDVHAPEYLTTQYGHMEIMDPYDCYHDDAIKDQSGGRRAEGGNKKNLTPTSSDERKRTKKRVATEDHVLGNSEQEVERMLQDQLYLELAGCAETSRLSAVKPGRSSCDQFDHPNSPEPAVRRGHQSGQRPTPAPRQAHVKQLSNGALVTLQVKNLNFVA